MLHRDIRVCVVLSLLILAWFESAVPMNRLVGGEGFNGPEWGHVYMNGTGGTPNVFLARVDYFRMKDYVPIQSCSCVLM